MIGGAVGVAQLGAVGFGTQDGRVSLYDKVGRVEVREGKLDDLVRLDPAAVEELEPL